MVVLSSFGFLFPQPNQQHIIPPQRPPIPPAEPDRVLFTYTASRAVPIKLGVIDTYDVSPSAWLPAYQSVNAEIASTSPETQASRSPQ